ncbi:YALI0C23254p [Yarrowia lipolytica CLIB122]|uniref:YALI0C23254p n=2 Tax=Yarrowia lipolytica TaxID=4952 RepID=Q6CAY9_YARLI|nr:YALI0C23254p [Yarrowia lipolytica CLIB122]AOW03298.1 hypothetical protein YALI1_C32079g [Yarrowia lipolytica]KAB8280303.1 hypothetical protein BKA91DRAFT_142180 [Yarrowia lipolytica]KAE8170248.1 hypothetical protein BKA90DRAFT_141203 [Yarrowia lipolytica]KAJ8053780.1 hypothetical protein LXG23DRAFT_22878 [Yarrowia lipolytica]RMI96226.1 hypothetical protein BD777DRAFT_128941 [Yarrowia lipolytica]|eukprot:XP_502173.1 YALI0C23254p [Yarrowia lipolytica CLIB122]
MVSINIFIISTLAAFVAAQAGFFVTQVSQGIVSGFVQGRSSGVDEQVASSEAAELVSLILNDPTLNPQFQTAADLVAFGFDGPKFVSFVSQAATAYSSFKDGPNFPIATSYFKEHNTDFNLNSAILSAQAQVTFYISLFTQQLNPLTVTPAVQTATASGISLAKDLFSELGNYDAVTVIPW